jgi:hypothetical protein
MSVRRLAVAAVLVAGGLALQPSPAHADVLTDLAADVELNSSTFPTGGACTVATTGQTSATAPVPADGQPHTASATAVITATQAPGDVMTATVTATSTITATATGGQLAHVVVQDSWSASFKSQGAGANCNLRVLIHGDTVGNFTLLHPAWVTVTATGHGVAEAGVLSNDGTPVVPGTDVIEIAAAGGGATGSVGVGQGLLPLQPSGGRLVVFPEHSGSAWAPTAANPASVRSGTGTVDIRLDTPGAATGPTSGPGRKYVELAGAEDCAAHTATATWSSKAGKGRTARIAKASFKVGHTTVGKVHHPHKKLVTTLKGLPATGPVDVVGTLKLRSGKILTVTGSYLPCG